MGSAILFSKVGAVASEFPGFVSELQILLVRDGMGVGSCEAVGELAERLRAGDSALRGDLASAIGRLAVEGRRISYLEVLGLLLAAAAGQKHADELAYAPALEEPVKDLFRFVVEARGGGGGGRSGGEPGENGFVRPSAEGEAESRLGAAGLSAGERAGVLGDVGREFGGLRDAGEADAVKGSVLARALALSAEGEEFGAADGGPPAAGEVKRFVSPERDIPLPEAMQRVRMYAVGVSGVLLGLLMGLLVGRWPVGRERAGKAAEIKQGNAVAGASRSGGAQPVAVLPASASSRATAAERSSEKAVVASGVSRLPGDPRGVSPGGDDTKKGGAGAAPADSFPASAPADGEVKPGVKPGGRVANLDVVAGEAHGSSAGAGRVAVPSVEVASAGIMAGNLLASPLPAYPPEASAARVEGEVVVSAVVGRDGSVVETRVVSGPPALCEAARKAVQAWRYRPYEIGGKPVEIITTARVDFHLNGQ